MTEKKIQEMARFYYLSVLSESQAYRLTSKTLKLLLSQSLPEDQLNVTIIKLCYKFWKSSLKDNFSFNPMAKEKWEIPFEINTSIWRQFQKNVDPNHLVIFIFHKVLKYSVEDIALGLKLTSGTIHFRSEKSLRLLSYYSSFGDFELT